LGQALALVILLVLGVAIYNKFNKSNSAKPRKNKSGDVIDISDAWIAMDNLPYRRKETVISVDEIALYRQLISLLPAEYTIFPKVRLADILLLPGNVENRTAYQARINDRAVDLLICSAEQLIPLLVIFIETDTDARKKQIRDNFVRRAVESSGLPCLTVKINPLPALDILAKQLIKAGIRTRM